MVTNGKSKSKLTLGCEGCENRKEIMGAGDWKFDAAIFALIIVGAIIFYKVKIA